MSAKKRKKTIPERNLSPYGWWIGMYLERFEFYDEDHSNPNRRCNAHENTVLITAKDRAEAYKKLLALGAAAEGMECVDTSTGRRGIWRFEGLTELLPIHDKIEDGAEILWTTHRNRSVKSIQALVKTKAELAVFDDCESP